MLVENLLDGLESSHRLFFIGKTGESLTFCSSVLDIPTEFIHSEVENVTADSMGKNILTIYVR